MAYTYNAALLLGQSQAGLAPALRAALVDTSGVIHATLRDVSAGFIEIAGGGYGWTTSVMPDGYSGYVVFYTGTLGVASDFAGVAYKTHAVVSTQETGVASVNVQKINGTPVTGDGSTTPWGP